MVMHEPLMSVYARGDGGRVENTQLMARSTEAVAERRDFSDSDLVSRFQTAAGWPWYLTPQSSDREAAGSGYCSGSRLETVFCVFGKTITRVSVKASSVHSFHRPTSPDPIQ